MPKEDKQSLASVAGKPRKKIVVEEVGETSIDAAKTEPEIEVPSKTEPHIEPGIHEEVSQPLAQPQPQSQPGLNVFLIVIPGIFLLGALLGGIFFYQTSMNKASKISPKASEEAIVIPTPSTSPQPKEFDLTKYPITILNGSGIKGEAGKVQVLLEKTGFKVSATGNATNYNYTETIIQIKDGVEKEFVSKLRQFLGENYKVSSKTQSLQISSKNDVEVIVGNSKN